MVDSTRQNNQVTLSQPNPHPIITLTSDIKVARTIENVSNLLILMQMLMEETLDLLFVNVSHFLW
jgi:hypothetical protein